MNGTSALNTSNVICQPTLTKSDVPQSSQKSFQSPINSEREKGQICCLVDSEIRLV